MWTHVSLNAHIVWEEVLWEARLIWQDGPDAEPIVLEKSGRVPLPADGGPEQAIAAAAAGLLRATDARLR